ncbi:hypothetical protein NEM05_10630, partial [Staphylococcus epidermidis]|nr:hypothetical protein [Staphylococcus epidermidis]
IRKVTAQRAENIQKKYKKDNFYIISIEIVFFHLSRYFMSRTLEKYYLLTCSSLTIRGLSGLTKNHRIAAIIAGTIKSCNVIDHPK